MKLSGKELQAAIIDFAHTKDWRVAHFHKVLATRRDGGARWLTPVAADGKGWPDLFLTREARAVVLEVKGDGDSLKPEQREWLAALEKIPGIEVFVVTPKMWRDGELDRILT